MWKCKRCGNKFDKDDARDTFNYFFEHEYDYDDHYNKYNPMCGTCAIWDFHIEITGEEPDFENVW